MNSHWPSYRLRTGVHVRHPSMKSLVELGVFLSQDSSIILYSCRFQRLCNQGTLSCVVALSYELGKTWKAGPEVSDCKVVTLRS